MLAPLIVAPLIISSLIVLTGWIYDTVVAGLEDKTVDPPDYEPSRWQGAERAGATSDRGRRIGPTANRRMGPRDCYEWS
jgi:hypothetical protein